MSAITRRRFLERAGSLPALLHFGRTRRAAFFLVYVNSFNEWHEGHAFEPMKNEADRTEEERFHGYHNPRYGDYRLAALSNALKGEFSPAGDSITPGQPR